jgi:ribosomal protein S18 acetylase RimI-like enzyme
LKIIIRCIHLDDIERRGYLEALESLVPPDIDKKNAKKILQQIMKNPLHKIFVAERQKEKEENKNKKKKMIVGTTTLLVEPKFISKGIRVGYIEDVSIKKGYEGLGIGSQLVSYVTKNALSVQGCGKVLLYCSSRTTAFYEKLGYKVANDTFVMKFEPTIS